MAWDYSEKLKDHFYHPRNVGVIDDADGKAEVGSIACGDALTLYLKLDRDKKRIEDAKFKTFGCGSAIAGASALTEMVVGKTLEEALRISNQDIADYLDGIPQEKMHCSVMGREALEAAVANARGERPEKVEHEEGRLVCRCFGVAEPKIERAIRENDLRTVEQVTHYTKAGGGCGTCAEEIQAIIDRVRRQQAETRPSAPPAQPRRLTNLRKIALIQETIEHEIRPALQKDGGDIELIDIEGDKVHIAFTGHCAGCKASGFTLAWAQDKLRELVSGSIVVVEHDAEEASK
ncbi:MAG: Fe-S cluster assembly protein NifU [Myxococcota bacterium]|nr:Fe-S cluster assembly protein NifU [Myxococcota bacterium]